MLFSQFQRSDKTLAISSWARTFDLQPLSVQALEEEEGEAGDRGGILDPVGT